MLPPGYTAVHNSRLPWTVLFNLFCFVLCVCFVPCIFCVFLCISLLLFFFFFVFCFLFLLYFYCIFLLYNYDLGKFIRKPQTARACTISTATAWSH